MSDLGRSVAFHRLWLPMLGFRRVWTGPDRVMWSRGYDHFVMRQAKEGISYGPGALWLAGATGHPVLPFHIEAERFWEAASWDRTQIPRPFTTVALVIGPPLNVPDTTAATVEEKRRELEAALASLEIRAREMLIGAPSTS